MLGDKRGMTLVLSVMFVLLISLSGKALAREPRVITPAILSGPEFPIGLWWPPPPEATTSERYLQIKEAGFNFVIGGNRTVDKEYSQRMLAAAEANQMRAIVTDERVTGRSFSHRYLDEERHHLTSVVDDYASFDSFAGLNLFDEPATSYFKSLALATDVLFDLDPHLLSYVNLYPSYVTSGALHADSYEEYVRRFIDEVNPQVLSFDHYPLLDDGERITADYFYNWAVIRQAALQAGIPPWIFIQSVDYNNHRLPSEAEILWQINVSLAYGAKGIMYFTYWTPGAGRERFGTALVTPWEYPTPLYTYAQRANAYLASVGGILLELGSESVQHKEDPLPRGALPFRADQWLSGVEGSPLIIGRFQAPSPPLSTDGNEADQRWVLVVNRSFSSPAQSVITMGEAVREVKRHDPVSGGYVSVAVDVDRTIEVQLPPGGAVLYLVK